MQPKEALRMPPPFAHKILTDAQKDTLRRWIEEDAPWKEHWAFTAPVRPTLPEAAGTWARNPIDRFIVAKLQTAGLQPGPEADSRTLIRRLSLDLTGLPPEPAEVEAFVHDQAPDAYDRLVEASTGMSIRAATRWCRNSKPAGCWTTPW